MESAFLELLLAEAPATEYEAPLERARRDGADPATLADLAGAKTLALRLRTKLARHRRRENELAALFSTAGDLATLRDLDDVLHAIVRRARRLLGTDVAYLTLEDAERGDTYMRVTDGSVAASFQQLRLPMGAGLGGLVAQTASPYRSPSYLADPQFAHTRDIDTGVRDEGLVAILGVPLRLGHRVIGVLFAADRRERRFGQDEIALLGSLADHAAIAIDSARMLTETRDALAELDRASRLGAARAAATERAATAHDRLTALVLRGGDLDDLACAVTDVLDGALSVLDSDGVRIAGAATDSGGSNRTVAELVGAARETGRAAHAGPYWVVAVTAGTEQLGALVLRTAATLDEADQRTLERAGLVTALILLFRRSAADAHARVGGDLLADLLLAPDRDPAGLGDRAHRLGLDLTQPHLLLAVAWTDDAHPGDGAARSRARPAALAAAHGGLATRYEGRDVLLLPGTDPAGTARMVATELRRHGTVAAAGPAVGPAAVAAAYREAIRCLSAALALGRRGDGVTTADLGFLGVVLGEDRDLDGYLAGTLGPLLDYDAARGARLVETLDAYFAADRSPSRARHALHVHPNTVHQRLDRITQLLGADWRSAARSMELQLALALHRARDTPPGR
jgi:GAF domain-containing protein